MNIALCLSGHIRNFCTNYIKKFKNIDVFLCTWDQINLKNDLIKDYKIFNFELMQDIHKLRYEIIEPYAQYTHPHKNRKGWDSYSNFFLQYQCFLLRKNYEIKNNKKYDLVIRFRPDYKFYIDSIPNLEENTLFFPENSNFHGITDNLILGSSELMDKLMQLYLVMDIYTISKKCNWINEHLVKYHLENLKIKTKTIKNFLYLDCNNDPPGGDQILTQEQLNKIRSLENVKII